MSYSRREVGFVDDLTHRLEKAGIKVWLDYRSLVPGKPWAGQIDAGLDESQIIVLVVSKASIASQYVELEWRRVLNTDKRIILAIFEAVDLPPELEKFEWVDFRGNYESGVKELIRQIQSPEVEDHPAPQSSRFKAPLIVWACVFLSIVTAFVSLYTLWTVLLPLVLFPLPWRILKRDFNFSRVQAALWLLPLGVAIFNVNNMNETIFYVEFFAVPTCLLLLYLLNSAGMQRWGKPEAIKPAFSNLYKPNNPNPKPVSFFIDHAAPDRRIADRIASALVKYGHPKAADMQSAEAVFVLISAYKTDSEADPESKVVYPILVQNAVPAPKLSKVQWIDFRRGIRNLDAVAQLLPNPAKLLAALGARPTGNQSVYPGIINSMLYLTTITAVATGGSFFYDLLHFDTSEYFFEKFVFVALSIWLAYAIIKGVGNRRGWTASIVGSVAGYILLNFVLTVLTSYETGSQELFTLAIPTLLIYRYGGIVLALLALTFYRQDYLNWLPWLPPRAKQK